MLLRMGKKVNNAQLTEMMATVDEDGSGEVDFDEFERWWDKTMAASGAILPNVFNYSGTACRAVLNDRCHLAHHSVMCVAVESNGLPRRAQRRVSWDTRCPAS